MTPTENHAAMQLPFGANASRLAAFTGKLIDIAFHQSGTLESHLERRLQFLQGIAQGGPPAAELVDGCFLLHATTIYRIQIRAPQSEKSTPLSKMFSDDQARFALAGFRKELIAVSESQYFHYFHLFPYSYFHLRSEASTASRITDATDDNPHSARCGRVVLSDLDMHPFPDLHKRGISPGFLTPRLCYDPFSVRRH